MTAKPSPSQPLSQFVRQVFLPARKYEKWYAYQFSTAVRWLRRTHRAVPRLSDLRPIVLATFHRGLLEMGVNPTRAAKLRTRLITIWRFAADMGVAELVVLPKVVRLSRMPAPVGEPGTLIQFFYEHYQPQVLPAGSGQAAAYYALFRRMGLCFGRNLQLSELSATVLAEYVGFLQQQGRSPRTQKAHRQLILALWRFAASQGMAPPLPIIRPIKVPREQPDAWSIEEIVRIIDAAGKLKRASIGGVQANKFWRALLLVGYYTALRRKSIFSIRVADVELETGWLYVSAARMKNRCGQQYRLGPDAIEAIREIYNPKREMLFPAPPAMSVLNRHFRAILKLAGVPNQSRNKLAYFHKLRRTTVTHTAVKAGLAAAIALAGHSGPEVNARYIDPRFLAQTDATAWLPKLKPDDDAAG